MERLRDLARIGRLGLLDGRREHVGGVVAVVASVGRCPLEGAVVAVQELPARDELARLQHGRGGVDARELAVALEHVGGLDGVSAQDVDAGVVRLHQRIDEGEHLEVVEGGDDHVHPLLLQAAGQRLEIGGLVVEGFAHGDLALFLGQLGGGPVRQALAVRRAVVEHRVAGCGQLRGGERAHGARLQGVVRDEPEGARESQLREVRMGGNGQLRDPLGGVDGRGLDADAGVQVAHHGHHARFDQLLRHGLAGGGVRAIVLGHHFQGDPLAIHHEAGLVQFVHRQLHAIEHVLPQRRERARQRLGHADLHRVRHAAAARQRQRGARHRQPCQRGTPAAPSHHTVHPLPRRLHHDRSIH